MRKVGLWTVSLAGVAMLVVGCGTANNTAGAGGSGTTNAALGTNNSSTGHTANGAADANTANSTGPGTAKTGGVSNGKTGPAQRWTAMPALTINVNKQYSAVVKTNYGSFTIQLFAKQSPQTVNNFVFLANHSFYNGDTFFRIIKDFMIQTGSPTNNGLGGPGYTIPDELPPAVPYTAGVVAMANTGQPNSGGSQFFICTVNDSQQLQARYTELGKVVSGMPVVEQIASIPVVANPQMNGEISKPTKKAAIEQITIEVK